MNTPNKIIVHHSGGTDKNPLADTSNQTAEIIRQYHKSLGWVDVGYHWLIEKSGKVCKGRDEKSTGAHCLGQNEQSIGICVIGNFDLTIPTEAQIVSLKTLLGDILSRYPSITKDEIYPHRKFANKTCYGNKLSDTWASDLVVEESLVKIPRSLLVKLSKYL